MQSLTREKYRRLQKNARNKESRLRKLGASEIQIKSTSPVLPWSEVEKMSPQQLGHYGRRLAAYNSRSNRLVVLRSGEILNYKSEIEPSKNLVRDINKGVDSLNRALERAFPGELKLDKKINLKEKPGSRSWAHTRIENLARRKSHDEKYYLNLQRENIDVQLRSLGIDDVAEKVKRLNNTQLEWLVRNKDYNLWDELNTYYIPNESGLQEAMIEKKERQLISEERNRTIEQWVDMALKINKVIRILK